MKIRSVIYNNHRKMFEVRTANRSLSFPYSKADPAPAGGDPVAKVFVDPEVGREGFTYVLASGKEGTILMDHVLNYNQDPDYLRDLLLYKLTLEAQERVERSSLSKRELTRRLETSATQLYRLLDQTNYRKSVDQMISLLQVLDCEVELSVRTKSSARRRAA